MINNGIKQSGLRLVLALLLLAFSVGSFAKHLTPSEALNMVQKATILKAKSRDNAAPMALAYTQYDRKNTEAVYVFSHGKEQQGFMLVAADDDVDELLLGYSDTNSFDEENIPSSMKWLLEVYSEYVAHAGSSLLRPAKAKAPRPAIDHLVKTTWGQDWPFNEQCPIIEGERSVTGCVATAMAQIMKCHEWPVQGVGSHSYSFKYNGNTYTDQADFGSTVYDWANMKNNYATGSTVVQRNAVAQLMHHCGVAADMGYTPNESAAVTLTAVSRLIDYFDYDAGMKYLNRGWFTSAEWDEIVYSQLAQGLPVLYNGRTINDEGHAFICDGYDGTGYYHINWGWDGYCDGYFLLSNLNPTGQGTGGSSDDSAFNYGQAIACDIMPNQGSSLIPIVAMNEEFTTDNTEYDRSGSEIITFSGGFYSYSLGTVNVQFGFELRAANGKSSFLGSWESKGLRQYYGYSELQAYAASLPVGEYDIYPAFRPIGGEWQTMYYDRTKYKGNVHAVVTESKVKISDGTSDPDPGPGPSDEDETVTESFEDAESFAQEFEGWTFIDGDEAAVGGFSNLPIPGIDVGTSTMSWIVMDSEAIGNSTFAGHTGTKSMMSLFNLGAVKNDDWLISPRLSGKAQTITLWAKSYSSDYAESMELLYSTTNTNTGSFKSVLTVSQVAGSWTKYSFEIPDNAKFFAIRHTSKDKFALLVDDVTYKPYVAKEGDISAEFNSWQPVNPSDDTFYVGHDYDFKYDISTDGSWEGDVTCIIFDENYVLHSLSEVRHLAFDYPEDCSMTFRVSMEGMEAGNYLLSLAYLIDNTLYFCSDVLAFDLQEEKALMGDVNGDGLLTESDITHTAGYILETLGESNTFNTELADIDTDGKVLVNDLTAIVDLVIEADNSSNAPVRESVQLDETSISALKILAPQHAEQRTALKDIAIKPSLTTTLTGQPTEGANLAKAQLLQFEEGAEVQQGQTATLNIVTSNSLAVRGFQFDMVLPEGLTPVVSKVGDTGHELSIAEVGNCTWRVLSYSMDNDEYEAAFGAVASVSILIPEDFAVGSYSVNVNNAYLSNHDNRKLADGAFTATLNVQQKVVLPDAYTITYIVDDEVYFTEEVKIGAVITPIAEPEKEGHTFSGWSEIPETMPAHDVVVTGSFTVNKYMVRYYDGEELLAEFEVEYGAEIPQYEYNNDDYIFEGWEGETYDTMPAHDIAFYAITTPNAISFVQIADDEEIAVYTPAGHVVFKGKKAEMPKRLKGLFLIKHGNKAAKYRI